MNFPDTYLVNPQQTLAAARQVGLAEEQLALSGIAVLTFSRAVVGRLDELCGLEDVQWICAPHHPYAAVHSVRRGEYQGLGVTTLVPPMGASPLAGILEDLVACGVQAFFLVCAAWSLGPPVQFGALILPTFSAGRDGTSIHHGNTAERLFADAKVLEALMAAWRERGVAAHSGGNATCEALYRITSQAVREARPCFIFHEPVSFVVTVRAAKGECRAVHKAGDCWRFDWCAPAGLCGSAYHTMYPVLHGLMLTSGRYEGLAAKETLVSCPDDGWITFCEMSQSLPCFFSQPSPLYDVQASSLFVVAVFPPA